MSASEMSAASSCSLRCNCWLSTCILTSSLVSLYCSVWSMPRCLASFAMAITRGSTPANCFFICGFALGANALISLSNSALVMTVLQSEALLAPSDGHTPVMVRTAASSGTDAEVSAAAWAGWAGGTLCAACPQASVPINTHTSQRIRIKHFLQDCSTRKVKNANGHASTVQRPVSDSVIE